MAVGVCCGRTDARDAGGVAGDPLRRADTGGKTRATDSNGSGVTIDLSKILGIGAVQAPIGTATLTASAPTAHAYRDGTAAPIGDAVLARTTSSWRGWSTR